MYTSETDQNIHFKGGKFVVEPSLSRGQWQGTQDDAGRVWRNVNDSPLFVDYTQPQYFLRNPNMGRTRGLYESVIDQIAATLYPVRPNRGVNRGYRDPFFRDDDSSIVIQGAGSPTSIAAISIRPTSKATCSSPTRRPTSCTSSRSSTRAAAS